MRSESQLREERALLSVQRGRVCWGGGVSFTEALKTIWLKDPSKKGL